MLGISDPWVWSAYCLCLAAAGLCLIYGIRYWLGGSE